MDPPPQLPRIVLSEDLQLEIIARADDVATVVRCAAASKPLRRAIRDPAFRRRLAKGGFDPALLADVSYRIREYGYDYTKNRVVVNISRRLQIDSSLLASFEPTWSRDGILVLWRNRKQDMSEPFVRQVDLLVCNVFTGELTRPPLIYAEGNAGIAGDVYRPALLATEGAAGGHSFEFELLVMDKFLQVHTFSSLDGSKWGDVRRVHSPQIDHQYFPIKKVCGAPAAVIGRIIHWLCHSVSRNPLNLPMIILAVDADTAAAAAIELPEGCLTSLGSWDAYLSDPAEDRLMLAATTTTDKASRLSLLVAETTAISLWTLITPGEGSNGWMRQAVIRRREFGVQLGSGLSTYKEIRFKGFGERSGTVLFWIDWVGLVQLNLVTKKAVLLRASSSKSRTGGEGRACLHEVDMESLLRRMKSF